MIVTVSGLPGSGKSTLAKSLAKSLGFRHYSSGDFWRQIAKEKGISILELNKLAEKNPALDRELDNRTVRLAEKEDNFVIDSRMAWHFIPKSVKIFAHVDLKEAARRVFMDKRQEKENTSIEETLKSMEKRTESERERYKKLYGADYTDRKNYDLVIDTTKTSPEQALEKALEFVKQYLKKP